MIWSSSNLNNLFTELGTKLSLFYPGTWIATLVVLALLLCLIVGIYLSFDNKKTSIFSYFDDNGILFKVNYGIFSHSMGFRNADVLYTLCCYRHLSTNGS